MHAEGIVARILEPCLVGLHAKRVAALKRAVVAVLQGGTVSLSAIAVHLCGGIALKHRLKSIDRLLGNAALHRVRFDVYRRLAQQWLGGVDQWLIVVDWSDATPDQRWQLLRASIVLEGRSVTLYEEIHPRKKLGNPAVHRAFVERLAVIVPSGGQVIVMTDAGFHAPWFKLIEAQGWCFLGRIRGKNRLKLGENDKWIPARDWFRGAGSEARDLGVGLYVQSNSVAVRAVLAKRPPKGRHALTIYNKKRKNHTSLKCARAAREPWLLASSLRLGHLSAATLIGLYAQRMRIEQSFRDTKNTRVGLGLEVARSRGRARLEMLLLLAQLASFVQRLIGESAKEQQLELQFMARRRPDRREISVLTLARRILDVAPERLDELAPWQAMPPLATQARAAFEARG
jgi:hypothetical protein